MVSAFGSEMLFQGIDRSRTKQSCIPFGTDSFSEVAKGNAQLRVPEREGPNRLVLHLHRLQLRNRELHSERHRRRAVFAAGLNLDIIRPLGDKAEGINLRSHQVFGGILERDEVNRQVSDEFDRDD